jgi:hypothetical protein
MPTIELLWTIREDRRREAAQVARERWIRQTDTRPARSIGRLIGWVRDRLRVRRESLSGSAGWRPSS